MKSLNALQPLGLLLLRAGLAIIFIYHGYPKLAHAISGTHSSLVEHGAGYLVSITGVIEVFGGGLLALGLFTRGAALLLGVEMCVALWKITSGTSYLAVKAYEFPMALAVSCLALATVGAGLISADHFLLEGSGDRGSRPPKTKK